MNNKRYLLVSVIVIAVLFFAVLFFISKLEDRVGASLLISNTEEEKAEIEDTNYEVESEGNTLDEAVEETIEEDIDQLSIGNEQEQEAEKSDIASDEKQESIISSPAIIPFETPVKHKGDGLRIGFVTDIHASSKFIDGAWRLGSIFSDRINYFLRQMNDRLGADMLIVNGDVIEGTKIPSNQGMEELRQIKELFDQTSIGKYWVIGNHDLRSVKKSQWKKALDIDYTHTSFKKKGYKIIILDSNFTIDGRDILPGTQYTRGNVSEKDMAWLQKELSTSEKKVVFIHHPPLRGISSTPDIGLIKNAGELRNLFSSGNVMAVFSGHIEDLYSEESDGVNYFVFPGLTKNPSYQGNFVSIDVDGDKITAEMIYIGKDGSYKTINIKKVGS